MLALTVTSIILLVVFVFVASYTWERSSIKKRFRFLVEIDPPRKTEPTKQVKKSIQCPPEQIRPIKRRGHCGLEGCKIRWPHSHVMDLAKRLNEDKK